jgi:hypothetical protein
VQCADAQHVADFDAGRDPNRLERLSMYSTCLFCARSLGRNETIEPFPVGRRVAFDGANGRLWVVCARCGRWNLSPLEERWEAVEACEHAFRGTRLRYSTENIGLARAADGLHLIRIGRPERPELAAWRYGSTFARRYRNYRVATIAGMVAGCLVTSGAIAAATVIPASVMALSAVQLFHVLRRRQELLGLIAEGEDPSLLTGKHIWSARLLAPNGDSGDAWGISILTENGTLLLHGESARRVASVVLAQLNQIGGTRDQIQSAVQLLDAAGDSDTLFTNTAAELNAHWNENRVSRRYGEYRTELRRVPQERRLALEMAVHEETECRALRGELKALELAWKEAEEVAAIADDLLLPERVRAFLYRHRTRRSHRQD